MNFEQLAQTRTAIQVDEEDIDLFCALAVKHGFGDLFGNELVPWDCDQDGRAHGFNGRPLSRRLSRGSLAFYEHEGFPICHFKDFDEYVEQTTCAGLDVEALMDILV